MERTEAQALNRLTERVETTLEQVDGTFPYYANPDNGEWVTTDDGNWCGGHWVGMLGLAYAQTENSRFAEAAEQCVAKVREHIPSQCMFAGMNYHYIGFKAFDITGDDDLRSLGIEGADMMVEYFNEKARQIPLGTLEIDSPAPEFRGPESGTGPSGDVLGAVDAIYTSLPILWRAARETGKSTYRDVAIAHADRHLEWYIRPDGRTWHHARFDPQTGELLTQYNELAYSDETCWARGQGWCIAGLARAYVATEADRYLSALETVVDYYRSNTPADGIPHWDFEHPEKPDVNRDTSAAALAADGLTRLPSNSVTRDLAEYGEHILHHLVSDYLTPLGEDDDRPPGMVLQGCYNGPSGFADRHELVWTDYYVMRTLSRRARTNN